MSKPSQDEIDELLARRPGGRPVQVNPTVEQVEEFLAGQRLKYPNNHRDEGSLAASLAHKGNRMSQHFIDEYCAYFSKMGREPNMQNIHSYAREYAASPELQAEFATVGGFVAFASQRRAVDQGLVKVLGTRAR